MRRLTEAAAGNTQMDGIFCGGLLHGFYIDKKYKKKQKIEKTIDIFTCIIKGLIKVLTEVREKCYTLVIKIKQFRGLNCRAK